VYLSLYTVIHVFTHPAFCAMSVVLFSIGVLKAVYTVIYVFTLPAFCAMSVVLCSIVCT
jgi:hypothetical protein